MQPDPSISQAAALAAPALPAATPAETVSKRRTTIVLGLFGILWFMSLSLPDVVSLAYIAATVLLALQSWRPAWYRLPAWLGRPLPGRLIAGVYAVAAMSSLSWSLASVLMLTAAWLVVRDAWERGDLGRVDPRLPWRGGWGRRLVLLGSVAAVLTLSIPWDVEYHVPFSYHASFSRGSVEFSNFMPSMTRGGTEDARSLGLATLPLVLLGASLLACAWTGSGAAPGGWLRRVPLVVGVVLTVWVIRQISANASSAGMLDTLGGSGSAADGPWYFLFSLIPFLVGAFLLMRASTPSPAAAPPADPLRSS